MYKICLLSFFFFSSLFGASITIALATNVSYAMEELKPAFNKQYPDIKVLTSFGSSGKLTAQIMHGAPYHLFMSADMKYPNALYKAGIALNKPVVYAKGSLALLSKKPLAFSSLAILREAKNIRRVAIANPKTSPYARATLEALKNANIYKIIKDKLVYGESIAQTLSYTLSATDFGIVATSALFTKQMRDFHKGVHWIEIDRNLYTPIEQGIVILKKGKNNTEVQAFYKFMQGEKAKRILEKFGYLVPGL
ncbi:MAG: molybdate ABC transporter substrate-binding protein [Sulfurimonas sp.]|nr:molybdate ABC transporter substrate-binding protein [Sulfurimonas sp.]